MLSFTGEYTARVHLWFTIHIKHHQQVARASTVHIASTIFTLNSNNTLLQPFVQDYLGELVPEKKNQSGFTGARDSEWQWHQMGPYANLHLAAYR